MRENGGLEPKNTNFFFFFCLWNFVLCDLILGNWKGEGRGGNEGDLEIEPPSRREPGDILQESQLTSYLDWKPRSRDPVHDNRRSS